MDNNIVKINDLNIISLIKLIGQRKMALFIIIFTILYFMTLAHKIPYVNFDGTSGKIEFILLGLSILVLIELSLELISAIAEMIKRNKRKEKFNNWMRTLDAESFSIVYQFYYHNSTILNYSDKLPVKLQISGIIKNAAHDCYSISQENFDFLTEFFDK